MQPVGGDFTPGRTLRLEWKLLKTVAHSAAGLAKRFVASDSTATRPTQHRYTSGLRRKLSRLGRVVIEIGCDALAISLVPASLFGR